MLIALGMMSTPDKVWLPLAALVLATGCVGSIVAGPDDEAGAGADAGAEPDDGDGEVQALSCELRSGDRLRATWSINSDGSKSAVGLHDSELGVDCEFLPAGPEQEIRCVPSRLDDPKVALGSQVYSDASCTQLMANLTIAGDQPTIMEHTGFEDDGCTYIRRYYRLGNALTPGGKQYYRLNGNCIESSIATTAPYEIVEEIPTSSLVAATERWIGDGRVQLLEYAGTDGSVSCVDRPTFRDMGMDGDLCDLRTAADGEVACLPDDYGPPSTDIYLDGACTQSFGKSVPMSCAPNRKFAMSREQQCGHDQRWRVFEAQELSAETEVYRFSGDNCHSDEYITHKVGAEVPAETFAHFERSYQPSSGRLQRGDLSYGDLRVQTGDWRDSELDVPCTFALAEDGVRRCLPISHQAPPAIMLTRYTDASCQIPMELGVAEDEAFCGAAAPRFIRHRVAVEPTRYRIHEVGAAYTGAIYERTDSGCQPSTGSFYQVGPIIPAEEFVSTSVEVE